MRVINQTLQPFIDKFAIDYFDDILIYNANEELHLQHLREVLLVLLLGSSRRFSMLIKPKVESIRSWPTSCTLTEVYSFYGLASFYHRFIPHFSSLRALSSIVLKVEGFYGLLMLIMIYYFIKSRVFIEKKKQLINN